MRTRIYVGNIPFTADEAQIRSFFEGHKLVEVKIITDRETGRQRGFAFVTFESADDARRAVDTLDGTEMGGRRIIVNEAKEREKNGAPPRRDNAPRFDNRRNGASERFNDRD